MDDSNAFDPLDAIAIIGMTCRFPGARNVDEFWQNLRDGVESITFFSDEELEAAGVDPAVLQAPNYVKARPVLKDVEWFDASFFKVNPKEAALMDPQHRLFLECAWEALESAGYDPERYGGRIGVYAGAEMSSYLLHNLITNRDRRTAAVSDLQVVIGVDRGYLSTRVSYELNLRGPSVTVQTSCSTSLVAVHLACESLLNSECDVALAGGVSVNVPQKTGYFYEEGGVTSPDGHCRAFDARAQGTIFGSGIGVVVLKRLADALADGDYIHAVIKGSAINNDGAFKIGYTAPSVDGQAAVINEALSVAGIDSETVTYVETHGTGTEMGDPIEIAALTRAFRLHTERKEFCAIGSLKTNVGHLAASAGVAGLIKTALALKHRLIPPSLNFERPNPRIDFANSPFYVNTTLRPWQTDGLPRRAGVSSFGMGGTNAHIVLEEAPAVEPSGPSRPCHLLVLSAKTDTALERATDNLVAHLRQHPDLNLADVACTLQVGRRVFNHRRTLVCRDLDDATAALETRDPKF
jgi:acyl transferase domain-containing protein